MWLQTYQVTATPNSHRRQPTSANFAPSGLGVTAQSFQRTSTCMRCLVLVRQELASWFRSADLARRARIPCIGKAAAPPRLGSCSAIPSRRNKRYFSTKRYDCAAVGARLRRLDAKEAVAWLLLVRDTKTKGQFASQSGLSPGTRAATRTAGPLTGPHAKADTGSHRRY